VASAADVAAAASVGAAAVSTSVAAAAAEKILFKISLSGVLFKEHHKL
jgi:hypothetical protein